MTFSDSQRLRGLVTATHTPIHADVEERRALAKLNAMGFFEWVK